MDEANGIAHLFRDRLERAPKKPGKKTRDGVRRHLRSRRPGGRTRIVTVAAVRELFNNYRFLTPLSRIYIVIDVTPGGHLFSPRRTCPA
jgi:hypothetical protein